MKNKNNAGIRIALAQANFMVGDVPGNGDKVIRLARQAQDELQADAIVFPELTLTGYPPEDLLLRQGLFTQVEAAMMHIAE
jgi:NAD+ synthase (glutamine-hydrolysing)